MELLLVPAAKVARTASHLQGLEMTKWMRVVRRCADLGVIVGGPTSLGQIVGGRRA